MSILNDLPALLRAARGTMTQAELAKAMGVTRVRVTQIESGEKAAGGWVDGPSAGLLERFADAAGCDLVIEFRRRE